MRALARALKDACKHVRARLLIKTLRKMAESPLRTESMLELRSDGEEERGEKEPLKTKGCW